MKEKKTLLYINIVLSAGLLLIIIVGLKITLPLIPKKASIYGLLPIEPRELSKGEGIIYDIGKVKPEERPAAKALVRDLDEMYRAFPKMDVGDSMTDGWSKVKPQDKAKFIDALDEKIAASKDALKKNPTDKRARRMLFLSEVLKKMAADNFNYKIR